MDDFGDASGKHVSGSSVCLMADVRHVSHRSWQAVSGQICGDNTIAEQPDVIIPQVIDIVKGAQADLFVEGPGFNAGRYGLGCGNTTAAVTEELDIPAVTALYSENPGTDLYKNRCYILQSDNNAKNMKNVVKQSAVFAKRLVAGENIADGKAEGYHGSGPAIKIDYTIPAATRGIDMLLAKYNKEPFYTEVVMPNHEEIPIPALEKPLSECKIAEGIGANRILKGNSVLHVFGAPTLPAASEQSYREKRVEKALHMLEVMPEFTPFPYKHM